jgi:hypothetical protein
MKKLILPLLLVAFTSINAQTDVSIYTTNGALTGNRMLTLGSYSLAFKPSALTDGLFLASNGSVAINKTNPTEKLDVAGNIKAVTGIFTNAVNNGVSWNGSYQQRAINCNVLSAGAVVDATWNYRTFQFWDFPQSDLDPTPTICLNLEDRSYKSRFAFMASANSSSSFLLRDRNQEPLFRIDENGNDKVVVDLPKPNSRIVIAGFGDYLPEHKFVVRGSSKIEGNILTDSNIGIGTSSFIDGSDTYRLSVNGAVRASRVRVYTDWADYVFEKGYSLPTLSEVEKHIAEKGHLINIPSAAEVKDKGIDLGEMNKLLLEKVEELTLYVIEMNKEMQKMKEELKNK